MSLPARAFECPICFLTFTNPMSCVECGYILCKEHVEGISECPLCKEKPFKAQVERGVRRLMNQVPYPCRFCKSSIPKGDLDVHEANCPKRQRRCGVAGCNFESSESTDALRHLIESHGQVIWENFTDATAAGMKTHNSTVVFVEFVNLLYSYPSDAFIIRATKLTKTHF